MKIENIRLGFATNSSSTHSLVKWPKNKPLPAEGWDGSSKFGWEEFILTSDEAKMAYLEATLISNGFGSKEEWDYNKYVDHQSVIFIPGKNGKPNQEYLDELRTLFKRNDVVIFGGNDNGEMMDTSPGKPIDLPTDTYKIVARREGDYWVLFDTYRGNRTTFSFKENPKPFTRPSSPFLVDLKITNYCTNRCEYCYQDSNARGIHGDTNNIKNVLKALGDLEVFEIAIGGGEPTNHPQLKTILQYAKKQNIISNMSTSKPEVFYKDPTLGEYLRGVGISLHHSKYAMYRDFEDIILAKNANKGTEFSFHLVVPYYDKETLDLILAGSRIHGITLVLLGFKLDGRGIRCPVNDKLPGLDYILRNKNASYISVDTKLAKENRALLKKHKINKIYYDDREGFTSLYIDAVEGKIKPASYNFMENQPEVTIDWDKDLKTQIQSAFIDFGKIYEKTK